MDWIIGVDVGGTFTDFFAYNTTSSESRYWKRPSTPSNPAEAIIVGLRELSDAYGIDLGSVTRLCHGSTVATNTLIQRSGAPVAMITTKGFRDVLAIGRQIRPAIHDLQLDQPAPLVPRRHRLEVGERVVADGSVLRPIDYADLASAIERIRADGISTVAVCLLFSYLNPTHEQEIGRVVRQQLPGVTVSLSSEVQPEFREFERFTTTVVNAYLQPRLDQYISTLLSELLKTLPNAKVGINQSSGGLMSLDVARSFPVRMALSGPAAGVVGAVEIARAAGRRNVITIDIGGTSADVALIRDFTAELSHGRDVDGFPVRLPMIDIATVGAGGGSIAWFESDGLFKVGPQSAGAVPGPACYQRGGTLPTVSDANLVLGRLPESLLDGEMILERDLAVKAIKSVADPMGKSVEDTALGMLDVMTANMVRAIRTMSIERGHDPRDFTLMPFGGAGALHARDVAVSLGMREILVPLAPGIVCAQGLTDAELQESFVISELLPADGSTEAAMFDVLARLRQRSEAWFDSEGIECTRRLVDYTADARFRGQNYELAISLGRQQGDKLDAITADLVRQRFFAAHERAYGYADRDAPIDLVNFRAMAHTSLGVRRPTAITHVGKQLPVANGSRLVRFSKDVALDTPAFQRGGLKPGDQIAGPAVVDQMDATTVIFPGDRATVDGHRNIIIEVASDA